MNFIELGLGIICIVQLLWSAILIGALIAGRRRHDRLANRHAALARDVAQLHRHRTGHTGEHTLPRPRPALPPLDAPGTNPIRTPGRHSAP